MASEKTAAAPHPASHEGGKQDGAHGQKEKLVTVTLDGHPQKIARGKYEVVDLKVLLGVPADYELDEVEDGEFKPLDDASDTHIEGREVFVSHVRRGGAS